jgi:hypothetical protein
VYKSTSRLMLRTCVAAFVLTACVPDSAQMSIQPGRYQDYHDFMVKIGLLAKFPPGAPSDIGIRYAECAADFVMDNTSPADRQKLDAYARGESTLTAGESRRMDANLEAAVGKSLTEGGLERLTPYCPDDVPDFQKYPPAKP